jgi:intraflagellar transport protein 56
LVILFIKFCDNLAIQAYLALCYYKLEYYELSQSSIAGYLQKLQSITASNLKACNYYKLLNNKLAEKELMNIEEVSHPNFQYARDLIRHNLVVFRNGSNNALEVLPPLVDVIPEARLNLIIYHLRNNDFESAFEISQDIDPASPYEFILKAVCLVSSHKSLENIKEAEGYFQFIGSAASECDTIHGRQCMASFYFLKGEYEESLIYLDSIKSYMIHDDAFNFNEAQAKMAIGNYEEAENALLNIQSNSYMNEFVYKTHLVRAYIMNRKAHLAWELYLQMNISTEAFRILKIIANDCYKMEEYYYAMKAFDAMDRLNSFPLTSDGKLGSCAGVFMQVVKGEEQPEMLRDTVSILKSIPDTNDIINVIVQWSIQNGIDIE